VRQGADGLGGDESILCFAPLPTLPLGVVIRQAEAAVLAPAAALRNRLVCLAVVRVALFVGFTLLSVRSVVRPVTRLTEALRRPISINYLDRNYTQT
jgi:hypothetical protein